MLAEVVQMMDGEIAQRALPAQLGFVRRTAQVRRGVAPHGGDAAAEPPGLRDQRVDRAALGRRGGEMVRGAGGRHVFSDTGRYGAALPGLKGLGRVATLAQ